LVDQLGPSVAWRHRTAIGAFLEAGDSFSDLDRKSSDRDLAAAGSVEDADSKTHEDTRNRQPLFGYVLCELALRCLSASPRAASVFARDAGQYVDSSRESVRAAARRLVDAVERRDATIRKELMASALSAVRDEADGAHATRNEDTGKRPGFAKTESEDVSPAARKRRAFYDVADA
jgi:hypothetical protein